MTTSTVGSVTVTAGTASTLSERSRRQVHGDRPGMGLTPAPYTSVTDMPSNPQSLEESNADVAPTGSGLTSQLQ